jgi:hypothetical protein
MSARAPTTFQTSQGTLAIKVRLSLEPVEAETPSSEATPNSSASATSVTTGGEALRRTADLLARFGGLSG